MALILTVLKKWLFSGVKVFEQKDLAALAFPGDNVVQVCTGIYENHFAR
jgi:hypothetical protein